MKSLKDYLTESKKTYNFRIKVAGDLPEKFEPTLKSLLEKYSVASMNKTKTPIQKTPLDFPNVKAQEVHIFEVSLEYPVTPPELRQYIGEKIQISGANLIVRGEGEASEEYQEDKEEAYIVKLNSDLENPNADIQKTVGEEGKMSFLSSLSKKEMSAYKGVNDAILADSAPSEKSAEVAKKEVKTTGIFANKKVSEPKGTRK